ncbi:MAG: tetratricopeptide repeat protein [Candidatus Krumholzibacteria bacterium]|nr:tetratricopeptide repeat protein [Candidatus Krumholzibacteria bacterium]
MSDELQNLIERYDRARDSRLFAPLADAYRKNGDVDKAIEILERGLEKMPHYASAHVILGKCYYDKGATERAKAEFRRVLELDGENLVALKFMGDILLAEDKRSEAAEFYRRILSIDATNAEVARALKEMEASFVVKEIDLADAKSMRDERPRELATMTLAGIYAAQGYYNKALRIYHDVLEREPGNMEAKEMVAKLEALMNVTEAERDKAFREDILTISLSDISEGLVSSTAGHGGEAADDGVETMPGPAKDGEGIEPGRALEGAAGRAAGTSASAPDEDKSEGSSGEPATTDRDMEQFRDWLKRLRNK